MQANTITCNTGILFILLHEHAFECSVQNCIVSTTFYKRLNVTAEQKCK